jgi:PAS domain-containing protein
VLDRDGRILLFNEACERATGFAARRCSAATRATS